MEVIACILPFFALVAVGAGALRLGALTPHTAGGLGRYVYWIAFPALLVHALAGTPPPSPDEARGLLAYAVAVAAPYVLASLLARWRGWSGEVRAALPLLAGANNDAFLGTPLVLAVFGPAAASHCGPLVALNWAIVVPSGVAALHRGARGGSAAGALLGALRNPVTVAALAGVALMLLTPHAAGHPAWPAPVETVMAAIAASSTAVALIALGAVTAIEGVRPAANEGAPIAVAVALRLLATPVLVWLATSLVGAPTSFRDAAVMLAACPTAVTAFIQAQGYGVFGRGAAQAVVLTTLVSALTLTALAALLAHV